MNDSPTRRIASARRARSRCSSSRRDSSSSAIELNSLPRAANSSLPSVGTRLEKSPRPIARAATSRLWTSACSVRETVIANAIASSRKPTSAPTTIHDAPDWSPDDAGRVTRIVRSGPSKPPTPSVATRSSWPSTVIDPFAGSFAPESSGRDAPTTPPPSSTTTPTSARSSRRVAKLVALSTEVTIRPSGLPSWSMIALRAGATPSSVPDWNGPGPSRSSSTLRAPTLRGGGVEPRLDRVRLLVGDRRPQAGVLDDLPAGGVRAAGALARTGSWRRAAPRRAGRRSAPPPTASRSGTAPARPRSSG